MWHIHKSCMRCCHADSQAKLSQEYATGFISHLYIWCSPVIPTQAEAFNLTRPRCLVTRRMGFTTLHPVANTSCICKPGSAPYTTVYHRCSSASNSVCRKRGHLVTITDQCKVRTTTGRGFVVNHNEILTAQVRLQRLVI